MKDLLRLFVNSLPGSLFICSTPIGNFDDITKRALFLLKDVPYIACEDTRKTKELLSAHDILSSQYLFRMDQYQEKRSFNEFQQCIQK